MKYSPLKAITVLISLTSLYLIILPQLPSSISNKLPSFRSRILQSSGDLTLPFATFNINNGLFQVYLSITQNVAMPYVTMAIKYNQPNQYFAIGLGTRMTNADMWVFEIQNSQITATDYIGTGNTTPNKDTDVGGTNDLQVLGYQITSTYSLIKFQRLLHTGDSNDVDLQAGITDIIWASGGGNGNNDKSGGNALLSNHGDSRGYLQVNLAQAALVGTSGAFVPLDYTITGVGVQGNAPFVDNTVKVHTIVSLIAWGFIVDVALILIRLLKGSNLNLGKYSISYQTIHGLLMLAAIIMSVVVTITMILEMDDPLDGLNRQKFHFVVGIIMLIFMALMVITGFWNWWHLKYSKHQWSKRNLVYKWIHIVLGVIIYLLAKANFITGALLYSNAALKLTIWIYLGVLFAIHIIVQAIVSYSNKNYNRVGSLAKAPSKYLLNNSLVEAINRGDSHEQLMKDFQGITWVILGNSIYDLTNFVHPGGNAILKACIGREVGRYYFGNYALEGSQVKPHKHSALATSLLKQFYVGEITQYESIFVQRKTNEELVSLDRHEWSVTNIKSISETTSQICFKDNFNQIDIKNFGFTLSSLGRHFKISLNKNRSKARLYTTALSLNAANIALRRNICKYFDQIMSSNSSNSNNVRFKFDQNYLQPQEHLPLYIKKYPLSKHGLSNVIHNLELQKAKNNFRISGPLGRGLEITPNTTGSICIICAGTGLLPLIDFLNLFLWKTMYDLIKNKAGAEKAKEINVLRFQFDNWFNGMKILLVGAFSTKEDILGLDIITRLAEISKKYKLNNFKALIRGYEDENIRGIPGRFTQEFLDKEVGIGHSKYYVCGPPQMNTDVPRTLEDLGVNKYRIFLV